MSLTQELKNLAMVDIFTEAKKTDLFITSVTMTKREIEKIINDVIAEREKRKSDRRLESEEPEL